jgi:crotonobetainyl-CoA:carnitine CoA-transferase CaiB-like acyl-CoA transferase
VSETGRKALPLEGIRIVDLTSVVMGPFASQILGDLGADVIKVESPEGDSTRNTGPAAEPGMAAIFLGANRNKRSVVLDLKQAGAREALQKIIATADVFMHSIRPQKLGALGLDPDTLLKKHPRLIFAGLHGFGADGPYGGLPAYDDVIQGMSGLAALTQMQTGEPRYFPTIAADKTSGLYAVIGILAAIAKRERSGHGGFVEIPMFESMVAFSLVEHLYGRHFDPPRSEPGYPRVLVEWRRPFKTADGYICMLPYTNAHWKNFFAETGSPELATDQRFATIAARTKNIAELYAFAGARIAERTSTAWTAICKRLEIPATPVKSLNEIIDDEHLRAMGFFVTLEDEKMGRVLFPSLPIRFDGEAAPIVMPARLGEHTREVLREAGLDEAAIERLWASPSSDAGDKHGRQ